MLRQGQEDKELFFDLIKRIEWKSSSDMIKKVKVLAEDKSKDIVILYFSFGPLAVNSHQQNPALCYSITAVPLSMATS